MSRLQPYRFRLYVAGRALNSVQAVANLRALCAAHVPGRHEIELVDVFVEPKRALADGVFMTPTLLKIAPGPHQRIVGSLSQTGPLLDALDIKTDPA